MIYIVLFVYTAFFSFLYMKRKKSESLKFTKRKLKNFVLFLFMIIPSVLIAGLRYGISVDYFKVYDRGFNIISNDFANSEFEVGFSLLVKMCSALIDESWFMFFVVSLITIVIYFIAMKQSKNYLLSTILFFGAGIYFDSFNGIRQYIVCAIFLYCFRFIEKNDWKKYFFIMGSCVFIHTSAIFTLPLYFLTKIRINKIYCMIISVLLFVFSNQFYNFMLYLMSLIPKYNDYITRNTISSQISLSASGILVALIALIPCIIYEKKMVKTNDGLFLYNLMMIGLVISFSTSFMPFAERLLYYTRTYILLAIPYTCTLVSKKKNELLQLSVVSLISCMNFVGIFWLDWYKVTPYISIFSK